MRYLKVMSLTIIFCIMMFNGICQTTPCNNYEFQKKYNSDVNNYINDIISSNDGGSVIIGRTDDFSNQDALILKINAQGNVLWAKRVGTNAADQFVNVKQTIDGGYIAVGQSQFASYGTIISKFSPTGNLVWTKSYPTFAFNISHKLAIIELQTGGFALTCVYTAGISKSMVLRIDNSGNVLWAKTYSNSGSLSSISNSLEQENDSLVVYGFYETGFLQQDQHRFIMKVSIVDGSVFWSKRWSNASADLFRDLYKKNGYYYANSVYNGVDQIVSLNSDGLVINSISLNSTTTNNRIDNFLPTIDTGLIIPKVDLSGNIFNFIKIKNAMVSSATSFQLQSGDYAIYPKITQGNSGEFVTAYQVTNPSSNNIRGIGIIKTSLFSSGSFCSSSPANIAAGPTNLTTGPFTWSSVVPVNLTGSGITFQETSIIFNEMTICSSVASASCSQATIIGNDTICLSSGNFRYRVLRDANCSNIVHFSIDPSIAQITATTDTSIDLFFLQEGITKLYSEINSACGSIRDSMLIIIKRNAGSLTLGNDQTYCGSANFIFNAGTGFKGYQWQDGSTNQTLNVNYPGIYYVTVTDFCNNTFTDTVHVTELSPAQIDIGPDLFICKGDSLLLSNPAGFITYIWTPQYNINSVPSTGATVFPAITTKYYLSAFNTAGCVSVDSVLVTVNNNPGINIGSDTSLCSGDSKILNAGSGFSQYAWSTGASSQQITISTASLFWVKVIDANGCKTTDSLSILNVYPLPVVSLAKDSFLCSGSSLLLDAGVGGSGYLWQDGTLNQTFAVNNIGKYWVSVTSINNCRASDTAEIKIIKPVPSNFIIADTSFCKSSSIILSPIKSFSSYLWSTSASTNNISVTTAGNYWLEVTNMDGCKSKEYTLVTTKDCLNRIFFPNAFTPNADTKNDLFRPSVTGVLSSFKLLLYNRYGQLIFSTGDYNKGWDGTIRGAKQNTGSFTWYSSYQFLNEAPQLQKGTVTLIR